MAQHEMSIVSSYRTTGGDLVFYVHDYVTFAYADQSPQFIKCDSEDEARELFETARAQADARGELA